MTAEVASTTNRSECGGAAGNSRSLLLLFDWPSNVSSDFRVFNLSEDIKNFLCICNRAFGLTVMNA